MTRRQLPPQIRKVTVVDRKTGKNVVRYEVRTEAGDGKDRRQVKRRFTTEKAARDYLVETQQSVRSGTYVGPSKLTVQQSITDWLSGKHKLKASTIRGHESKFAPLIEAYGAMPIQKLTKADLDRLVVDLRDGNVEGRKPWSARSINYLLTITAQMLDSELEQGRVTRNFANLVDRMPADQAEMKVLSESDMFRVLDHECRDRHLWTLALYGLRRGELAGLRWTNVDIKARTVRITENRVEVGDQIQVTTPKSDRSKRTLPMPDEVVQVLKAAKRQQRAERLALGEAYGAGEYVACDEAGRPYPPTHLTDAWRRMLAELKIDHVRLHDARHSCATLMHKRQVPIAVISAWLGHSSAAFTMAVYTHAEADAIEAAGQSFR